ncbi:MAG: hypothetical protein ACHP7D_02375 [Lysobacterales bacterium]
MKCLFASIAAALFAAYGGAIAADNTLETVIVHRGDLSVDCTPPSSVPSCAALHTKIRANFSPREIQVLFGARTATAEAPTAYPHLKERYDAFMSGVDVAALKKPGAMQTAK